MLYVFQEPHYKKRTLQFLAQSPYELVEVIGQGAYGVCYLLKHRETSTLAILKRLKTKHRNKKTIAAFLQEIAFLKELSQLAVPTILEDGMIGQLPYYIMSYAAGETFEQAIFARGKQFSITETLHYTEQLLYFMEQLHAKHIVHRDLRIPNIIVQDGQLTIIDFGLATVREPSYSKDYLANPKKAPHAISDLYALGHFMLFLLYSRFDATGKKSTCWQQELMLPAPLKHYIERLLTIEQPFSTAQQAREALKIIKEKS